MAANYELPDVVEKRVRFFDGQFLQDQDFVDEQKYHLDRTHRHNRQLHGAGIVEGLTVAADGDGQVAIAAGTAIDDNGRQLVLAQAEKHAVDVPADSEGHRLFLIYDEQATDQQAGTGSADDTRWSEQPKVELVLQGENYEGDMPPVLLAELKVDKGIITIDTSGCQYAGVRLPGPTADAPILRTASNNRVKLTGALAVTEDVVIGAVDGDGSITASTGELTVKGPTTLQNTLSVGGTTIAKESLIVGQSDTKGYQDIEADGNDLIVNGQFAAAGIAGSAIFKLGVGYAPPADQGEGTLVVQGNVGIGTTGPKDKLHVSGGNIRLEDGHELFFSDNGQIRSTDDNHRILFMRDKNEMELREFGDLIFSPGSTSGKRTQKVVMKADGTTSVNGNLVVGQSDKKGYKNVTADGNDLIVAGQFAAAGSSGSSIYKLGVGYAPPTQKEGTLVVSGNVGVGTANPQAKLDVNGSMRVARGQAVQGIPIIDFQSKNWKFGWHQGSAKTVTLNFDLPQPVASATAFLAGWHLEYDNREAVKAIGVLVNTSVSGHRVTATIACFLRDMTGFFDDRYKGEGRIVVIAKLKNSI